MSLQEFKTVTLADVSMNNKGEYGIGASAVDYSDDLYTYFNNKDNDSRIIFIKSFLTLMSSSSFNSVII